MAHALAAFIRERTDEKGWRNADLVRESGLSRQVVSKHLNDEREVIARLPDKATLEGFAKAFGVPVDFLIGKAVESLGLGYTSGDFVNSVATVHDRELLAELRRRLDSAKPRVDVHFVDQFVELLLAEVGGDPDEAMRRVPDIFFEDQLVSEHVGPVMARLRAIRTEEAASAARDFPPALRLTEAARDIGDLSAGQKRRRDAEAAGEPPADDPNDMEPR